MLARRRFLFGGAALGVVGCGSPEDFANTVPLSQSLSPTPTTSSRLFVFNAAGGTRVGDQLRCTQVASDVIWFDDRPARMAGRQSTQSFLQDWSRLGFVSDPPNAVLQVDNLSFPLVLSQPVFDGPAQTVTFTIQPDAGAPNLDRLPTRFGDCALFIDDAGDGYQAAMLLSLRFSVSPGDTVEVTLAADQVSLSFAVGQPGVQSGLVLDASSPIGPMTIYTFFNSILITSPPGGNSSPFDVNVYLLAQPGIQTFRMVARSQNSTSQVFVTSPVQVELGIVPTQIVWVDA